MRISRSFVLQSHILGFFIRNLSHILCFDSIRTKFVV